MTLLSDQDLTSMRSVLAESLPDTCVIQTLGGTVDANGEGVQGFTAAGTVDCRLAPMRGDERERGDRISEDADWIVTLPAETSVSVASRLVIDGSAYDVAAVRAPRSWEISRRVEATKVT